MGRDAQTYFNLWLFCAEMPPFIAVAGQSRSIRKAHVMSKRENDANNIFRPSDSPLTEYEKEQIALRKNLERLKAERLAREAANSKND